MGSAIERLKKRVGNVNSTTTGTGFTTISSGSALNRLKSRIGDPASASAQLDNLIRSGQVSTQKLIAPKSTITTVSPMTTASARQEQFALKTGKSFAPTTTRLKPVEVNLDLGTTSARNEQFALKNNTVPKVETRAKYTYESVQDRINNYQTDFDSIVKHYGATQGKDGSWTFKTQEGLDAANKLQQELTEALADYNGYYSSKSFLEKETRSAQSKVDTAKKTESDAWDAYNRYNTSTNWSEVDQNAMDKLSADVTAAQKSREEAESYLGNLTSNSYYQMYKNILGNMDKVSSALYAEAKKVYEDQQALELATAYKDDVTREERQTAIARITREYGEDALKSVKSVQALSRQLLEKLDNYRAQLRAQNEDYDLDRLIEYEDKLASQEDAAGKAASLSKWIDEHGFLGKVAASAGSVLASPAQGGEYLGSVLESIGHNDPTNLDTYVPMDTSKMEVTNFVSGVRENVAEDMGAIGSFLYQTGMSIADSAFQVGTMNQAATVFMGMSAASNQMKNVIERGGTNNQAIYSGLVAGVAEALFEHISIDKLLSPKYVGNFKGWIKDSFKQAGVEASEEVFTEIANIMADDAIMGDNSEFNNLVAYYQTPEGGGLSKEEARKKAYLERLGQVALAGLGGFLSGGVMGGTVTGVNVFRAKSIGQQLQVAGALEQVQLAKTLTDKSDTTTMTRLNAFEAELKKEGGTVDAGTLGVIAMENSAKVQELVNLAKGYDTPKVAAALDNLYTQGKNSGYYTQAVVADLKAAIKEAAQTGAVAVQTAATPLETKAAETQVANPKAEVQDAATSLFLQQGMNLKTAQTRADIVRRLVEGDETVTERELNKIEPTHSTTKQIFTQLTGVQFPETKLSMKETQEIYRSAHAVMQQKQDVQTSQTIQPQQVQAVNVPVAQTQNAVTSAAQTVPTQAVENPAGGNTQAGFAHFVAEAQQQFPNATQGQLAAEYSQYMNGSKTVTFAGRSLNREQFIQLMRSAPNGQNLSQSELDAMFNRAIVDAMNGKDALGRFALRQNVPIRPMTQEGKAALRATQDAMAQRWGNILKPFGITEVRMADDMADGENASYENGVVTFNRNRITDEHALAWTLGHELVHSIRNKDLRETFVNDVIGTFEALGEIKNVQKEVDRLRKTYEEHSGKKHDDTYIREELAADLMSKAFRDQSMMVKLGVAKPSLLYKAKRILARLKGEANSSKEARAAIESLQSRLLEAIRVSGADEANVRTEEDLTEQSPEERFSIDTLAEAVGLTFEKDGQRTVLRDANGNEISELTPDQIRKTPLGAVIHAGVEGKFITEEQEEQQLQFFSDFIKMMLTTQDIDLLWAVSGAIGFQPIESGPRDLSKSDQSGKKNRFAGYTNNSDAQYSKTVDFTTICLKTQAVIDAMSETMMKLGHGLTEQEIVDIVYRNVHEAGEPVPCPVCYVFSRWVGLGGLFDKMKSLQLQYENASEEELRSAIEDLRKQAKKIQERSDKKMRDSKALEQLAKEKNNRVNELNAKKNLGLLQNKETLTKAEQAELDQLTADLEILDNLAWLEQVRLAKNYEAVPDDVLFNINAGERFANDYPASWAFRTSRGPAMGKAATPYAPEHLGQILRGAGLGNLNAAAALGDPAKNEFIKAEDGKLSKTAQKQLTKSRQKVKAQNLLGGQRYQSTSDFRFEYALDYLLSFVELQTLGSKIQLYTKVPESVEMWASIGAETNCSLMPLGVGYRKNKNGTYTLTFSSVTGMNAADAFRLAEKYDNVQTIMVGTSDLHIELCLADDRIGFVIPYHASGATEGRYLALMEIVAEHTVDRDDYSAYQTDSVRADSTPEQNAARSAREKILTGKSGSLTETERFAVRNNKWLSELHKRFTGRTVDGKTEPIQEMYLPESERGKESIYDPECYGVVLTANQAKQVMPYEFWDKTSTRETADVNGKAFAEYCESLGLHPRFSGYTSDGKYHAEKDFSQKPGYWKTLIDRCMYNNDGTYHEQRAIDVTNFKADYTLREPSIQDIEMPSILNDPTKTEAIAEKSAKQVAEGRGKRYSIAGENAADADKSGLSYAMAMAALGASNARIRKATGWFNGKDGKWRFEISDHDMEYLAPNIKSGKITDFVKHDTLFRNYPQLKNVEVYADIAEDGVVGSTEGNKIHINPSFDETELKKTLIHELQHMVQEIEGFALGSSPDIAYAELFVAAKEMLEERGTLDGIRGYEAKVDAVEKEILARYGKLNTSAEDSMAHAVTRVYDLSVGEREARNTEERIDLSPSERATQEPYMADTGLATDLGTLPAMYDDAHKALGWNGVDKKYAPIYNRARKRWYGETGNGFSRLGNDGRDESELRGSHRANQLGTEETQTRNESRNGLAGRAERETNASGNLGAQHNRTINHKASDDSGAFSLPEKRYSIDSTGRQLTEEQQSFFANSQVRDEEGRLIPVFHGTPAGGFTEFKVPESLSRMMNAQGAGFYFTDDKNARQYMKPVNGKAKGDAQLYEVYLNLTNPLVIDSYGGTTISKEQFKEVIRRGNYGWFRERGLAHHARLGQDASFEEQLDAWTEKVFRAAIDDADVLAEMTLAYRGDAILDVMKDVLGHDGVRYRDQYGDIWVAWSSNQIKNVNNANPTESNDIRYSLNDGEYADTFYSHMGKVIDEMKMPRLGAANGINYLKGRGVKDEEIKWSGIEEFLAGKKSVSKEELQEFVRNNQLVIEEDVLGDKDNIELTEKEQQRVDRYREIREEAAAEIDKLLEDGPLDLHAEWQASKDLAASEMGLGYITRSDFFMFGEAVNNYRINELRAKKEAVPSMNELRSFITRNDDFGFDSWTDALQAIRADPADFARNFELSDEDKQYLLDFAELKKRNDKVVQEWRNSPEGVKLQEIDTWIDDAMDAFDAEEHILERAKKNMHRTRWKQYSTNGGHNYREILFRMPDSSYTNDAMEAHWKEGAQGILAHARIQDFDTADGKMLFIEEIQSDWHNAGQKFGYEMSADEEVAQVLKVQAQLDAVRAQIEDMVSKMDAELVRMDEQEQDGVPVDDTQYKKLAEEYGKLGERNIKLGHKLNLLVNYKHKRAPQAPFADTYHEFVLKRLLREAAEQGYSSIGWTTGKMQEERWDSKYAESYRIEYDQDIPKFLNKYGKKWGAIVGKTTLETGETDRSGNPRFDGGNYTAEVWSMPITDAMRESVLYEGQPRFSLSDSEYMAAVQSNDMETAQQMVREAAQAAGYTIEAYHGTNADFTVFDKNRIGKGIDKYGAGFYFANRADISEAYGTKNYSTFLKLENPIRIRSTQKGGEDLRNVKITKKQAAEILKRHPLMYTEESPLGDFYEEFWETGAKAWMINDLAGKYTELGYLEGDLFKDYPNEFHEAVRDVTGHDGVVVYLDYDNFYEEQSDYFYIAWFDNQMKSSEPVVRDDSGEVIPLSERFNESKNDIRYSLSDGEGVDEEAQKVVNSLKRKARFSRYPENGYASYTTERMERELQNSMAKGHPDYARSYIAWVKPIDFIYATTTSRNSRDHLKQEAGELDVDRLRGESQPIYLMVDMETGEILGHEGRHRMLALEEAGVKDVAVIIDAMNDDRYHTKPIRFMMLKGQDFGEYRQGLDFSILNVLPMSERYADAVRESFSLERSDVKFSLSDSEYMAAVENGDMETAQRMVNEAAKAAGYDLEGYHGTDAQFTEFKYGDIGYHIGTEAQAKSRLKDTGLRSTQASRAPRIMHLFANIQNPLRTAFDFGDWRGKNVADLLLETEQWEVGYHDNAEEINARLEEIARMPNGAFTDKTLKEFLQSLGYDGIVYENQFEAADRSDEYFDGEYDDSYIAFEASQLKSADPVTYDDNGNVIPLSQRFNSEDPDIRYSITPEFEEWYLSQFPADQQEQARANLEGARQWEVLQAQTKEGDFDGARLAGQMAQGRKMAPQIRKAEEKLKAEKEKARVAAKQAREDKMKALADQDLAWNIHHTAEIRAERQRGKEKLAEQRRELNAEKRKAVSETKEIERATAAAHREADTVMMKAKAAERLRRNDERWKQKADENRNRWNLKRKAAAKALSDSKKVTEKRNAHETEQGMVNTIRKAPGDKKYVERLQESATNLRTLGRAAYRNFVSRAADIEAFGRRQVSGIRADTLVNIVGATPTTIEHIFKSGLVDRNGNRIGGSMKEVFLVMDKRGRVDEERQALLQDYMLHLHNTDRMGIEDKALDQLHAYEVENPWLLEMDPKEFALLVGMTETEVKKTGKQEAQKRAVEYAKLLDNYNTAENKPIFPDEDGNPVTAKTSRGIVEKHLQENPWLEEKANGIYEWWDLFMKTWAIGDSLTQSQYDAMREMYPHYVPTYRVQDKTGAAVSVAVTGARPGQAVKRATGGLSQVMNIEDGFSQLVSKIVKLNRVNEFYKNIVDTAMLDESGDFWDMAVFDWDSVAKKDVPLLRPDFADQAEDADAVGLEKTEHGDYRLSAWYDGKLYSCFLSEDMFKAISDIAGKTNSDLERILLKAGNALTGAMKTAITGINPTFALRNISRDIPTAIVNSISGFAFPKYWAKALNEMRKNSDRWQQFRALGGTHAEYYNQEQGFANAMAERRGAGAKVVGALGWFNEVTEAQTRFAEYLATIDRLGDTYENRLLGIKNSAEVTVDFSRKGKYGKVINAWVPYWNPAVQGIDKTIRSVIESKDGSAIWRKAVVTVGRAAVINVLAEAVLYAVLKALGRYDDWEELDDRTKDTYYCIPLPTEHKFLKIPRNREWGAILGAPIQRILEYANGRENPFENYVQTALQPNFMAGNIVPVWDGEKWSSDMIIVSQALDLAQNKNFYGSSIVPYAYQQGSVTEQYDSETSILGRALGELLNFSPMQIDYLISDYFGDFGDLFINATSEATWAGDNTVVDLAQSVLNMVTDPFLTNSQYSNRSVSKYYDTLDELEKVVQDKKNQMGSDAYKNTVEYQTQTALNKLYGNTISELNKEVRNLPDGEEKDALKEQIATIAAAALEYYDQCMSGEIANPVLDATYSTVSDHISDELIRLDAFADDYAFEPTYSPSKTYTDPHRKTREYNLDEDQRDYLEKLFLVEYDKQVTELLNSSKYKNLSDEKKAEKIAEVRSDAIEAAKEQFFDWLEETGVRSTKKD